MTSGRLEGPMTTFSPSSRNTTRLPQVGQDGQPLTRRQRRELERANELAGSRGSDSAGPTGSVDSAGSVESGESAAPNWTQPAPSPDLSDLSLPSNPSYSSPFSPSHAQPIETSELSPPWMQPIPTAPAEEPVPEAPRSAAPAPVSEPAEALSPAAQSSPSSDEPPTTTGAQRAIGAALGRPRPRGYIAAVLAIMAAVAIVAAPLAVSRMWGGGAGSASSAGAAPGGSINADGPLDTVLEVAGRVGAVPVVSLKGNLSPASAISTDQVVTGDGRALGAGDAVVLSVAVFDGGDGTNVTGNKTGTRLYRGLLDPNKIGESLANAVTGVTEGSRIVVRAPRTKEDQTKTTEITVIDILPTTAAGTSQQPVEGMPTVTTNADGTVGLSVQGLPVPTHSTAAVLVQGDGPQVQSDSVVLARYATVNWTDGQQQATTYGATTLPGTIDMNNALAGVREQLVDAQVGSRLVISIPADQAAGEGAVAVVIDVLAIADDGLTDAAVPATPSPDDGPGTVHVTPGASPGTSQ